MNTRAGLLTASGLLLLVALLAGFVLQPDFFTPGAAAEGGNETTIALVRDLSRRMEVLEREIAAMKEPAAVGGNAPSINQADVAKVLGEMSDRWMRSMSDSLEDIKTELNAIRRILEQ